ncbi:MAG: AMP-binding protein [Opitutaceae bacterium]|nr:AMP-binding protein [Opitutaceae bacterium]
MSSTSHRRTYLPWLLELFLLPSLRLFYRVRALHAARVPKRGGVLLVANHLSFMDLAVLQLACPRRIRFLGMAGLNQNWFFNWFYEITGTIIVSPQNSIDSMRRITQALEAGEVVLLFPEGGVSRTGELMKLQRGFELVARRAGVPVQPVAHDGLWGSLFSFSDNRYLFKSPRLKRTPVCVCFGHPIPPGEADPARVRQNLLDLGEEAFRRRDVLNRHLGREVLRALAKRLRQVQFIDRTGERAEVSSLKLVGAACALAGRIRQTIPEHRVGIVLPPGAGATIANLAVLVAGKVPVNLNFTAGRAATEASMRIGEIKTILTAAAMRERLPHFPWPAATLDLKEEIAATGKRTILLWMLLAWLLPNQLLPVLRGVPRHGGDEEAGLLFTSGTAGEPKGVVLTHRNILANCWQISSTSILPPSSVVLACLPLFHGFGFTVTLWYMILRGCRTITVPNALDSRKIVDSIREEAITVLIGAPAFLRPLLKRAEPGELRTLELVVSGAEKMPMDMYNAFVDQFHIEVMQGYGLTETTPVTNVNQHHPPAITETAEFQVGKRLGSVGRMLPGLTARIVNPDTMEEIPATQTGMLLFRGANVFGGYLKDPEKTRAAFHHGWFITGDLARFDEDGFLYIEGRLSRFSKIGGEMVPHGTIEQTIIDVFDLDENEEGATLAIIGVPDPGKGEALVLLTSRPGLTPEALRAKLTEAGLANLWIPRIVIQTGKVPMLGTGKLDLKNCRELVLRELERSSE